MQKKSNLTLPIRRGSLGDEQEATLSEITSYVIRCISQINWRVLQLGESSLKTSTTASLLILFVHFKCNKDTVHDDKRCRCEIPKKSHIKRLRLFSLRSHKKSSTVWDFIMREAQLGSSGPARFCIVNSFHRFLLTRFHFISRETWTFLAWIWKHIMKNIKKLLFYDIKISNAWRISSKVDSEISFPNFFASLINVSQHSSWSLSLCKRDSQR